MSGNNHVQVSYTKGLSFRFIDHDTTIRFQCSAYTGKERVFVNDTLVSESQSLKKQSLHKFSVKGNDYVIEIKTNNLWTGNVECSLSKNNHPYQTYKLQYVRSIRGRWGRHLVPIVGGALIGVAYTNNFMTLGVVITVACLFVVAITVWNKGHWESEIVYPQSAN